MREEVHGYPQFLWGSAWSETFVTFGLLLLPWICDSQSETTALLLNNCWLLMAAHYLLISSSLCIGADVSGYACLSSGLTSESGLCSDGYYCPGGQQTYTPTEYICPPGFYCPAGSPSPTICSRGNVRITSLSLPQFQLSYLFCFVWYAGSYAPNQGMGVCDGCPSGAYCDHYELGNVTGVVVPTPCPAGYYCPSRTEYATQNPCPPGTFSNDTSLDAEGDAILWST